MSLEYKKKRLELSRVSLAREEMELKIQERQVEIEKLQEYIKIQVAKELELSEDLKKLANN